MVTTGTAVSVTAGAATGAIDFALIKEGSITGTVTSAGTTAPLAGASVYVYNSSGSQVGGSVTTNASGVYTKGGLTTGTYYVRTQNSLGYADELYNDKPCPGGACTVTTGTAVSVTAGAATGAIDFALVVGGSITGTVTTAGTTTPLPGVTVYFYNSSGTYVSGGVTTNASGVYTKGGLTTGTYYVRTSNSLGYLDELHSDIPCPGGGCTVTTGMGVAVTAGTATAGIDFALAMGGTLTGMVTDAATGLPLEKVGVEITHYIANRAVSMTVATNASGVYTVTGLATGTSFLRTSNTLGYIDELYNDIPCMGGACTVTTGTGATVTAGATTSGINFGLSPGATIAGTVTDAGSTAPLANTPVAVHNASGTAVRSATTNSSGQYAVSGLATGTYYVRSVTTQNYVNEIYADISCPSCTTTTTSSITVPSGATGVPVTAGGPTAAGIDFGLAPGGTITGTVTSAATTVPLAGVGVSIYTASGILAGAATTNSSGVYTKTALSPGTYYARASSSGSYVGELYDNLALGTPSTSGAPIVVTAGGTATASFALDANAGPNDSASAAVLPMGTTPDLIYSAGQAPDVLWYKFFVPVEDAGKDLKVNVRVTSPYPDPKPATWSSDSGFQSARRRAGRSRHSYQLLRQRNALPSQRGLGLVLHQRPLRQHQLSRCSGRPLCHHSGDGHELRPRLHQRPGGGRQRAGHRTGVRRRL